MAKVAKKQSKLEHSLEVLKKVVDKAIAKDPEVRVLLNGVLISFKRNMKSKAANAKDRKYTSNQKHEKEYSKKRKSAIVKYKTKK